MHIADAPMELETDIDLSPCLGLESVQIQVLPMFENDGKASVVLKDMLASWKAEVPVQVVRIVPNIEFMFTRRGYADLLGKMGHALEEWLGDTAGPSSIDQETSGRHWRRRVVVYIRDWGYWEDWWWQQIKKSFPTFVGFGALEMNYHLREYSSATGVTTSMEGSLSRHLS